MHVSSAVVAIPCKHFARVIHPSKRVFRLIPQCRLCHFGRSFLRRLRFSINITTRYANALFRGDESQFASGNSLSVRSAEGGLQTNVTKASLHILI